MNQAPTNDELERLNLYIVCKNENCGSIAIKEITGENETSVDMCTSCGAVNYTKVITEEEYLKLQMKETV